MESPYVVIVTPNPSCFFGGARDFRKFLSRGEFGAIRIPRYGCCGFVHRQKILDLGQALASGAIGIGHGEVSPKVSCCTTPVLQVSKLIEGHISDSRKISTTPADAMTITPHFSGFGGVAPRLPLAAALLRHSDYREASRPVKDTFRASFQKSKSRVCR